MNTEKKESFGIVNNQRKFYFHTFENISLGFCMSSIFSIANDSTRERGMKVIKLKQTYVAFFSTFMAKISP